MFQNRQSLLVLEDTIPQEINSNVETIVLKINEIAIADPMIKHRFFVQLLGVSVDNKETYVRVTCCLEVFREDKYCPAVYSEEEDLLVADPVDNFLFQQLLHIYKDLVWDYAKDINDTEWGRLAYFRRPTKFKIDTKS